MQEQEPKTKPQITKSKSTPSTGVAFGEGRLVELLYDPGDRRTSFAVWDAENWQKADRTTVGKETLVPYSPDNNLIKHNVVLLPSGPEEYGSAEDLIREIQTFIHRYVDLSPRFERVASYYVLLSWVYDAFNELPYLRVRGDYGSGKTRFLLTVGSLCYKPVFASGASTVSPIFHILDRFRGTLVIDEGDFLFSDEKADIVKILNNGNVRGMPVLRSEVGMNREINPRAFNVYGPKIVATRGYYADRALESRFITEETGERLLRDDIPINLPSCYQEEARTLRNKLLLFRFRNLATIKPHPALVQAGLEPRLNQIFVPLLSVVDDEEAREELQKIAKEYQEDLIAERGLDIEAQILEAIRDLQRVVPSGRVPVKDIAHLVASRDDADYEGRITPKWIGMVLRKQLKLKTRKSQGVYAIPPTEYPKLQRLYQKYGLTVKENRPAKKGEPPENLPVGDLVDFGDLWRGKNN